MKHILPQNLKRILLLFTALLLCCTMLLLSSCTLLTQTLIPLLSGRDGYYTEYGISASIEEEYDEEYETLARERLSQLKNYLKKNDSADCEAFLQCYIDFEQYIYSIMNHGTLLYVAFCKDPNNQESFEEYDRLNKLSVDLVAEINQLYDDIYGSVFSSAFYENWSQEDIDDALRQSALYTDEFVEITNERDEYVLLYQQLNQDDRSFMTQSAEYYEQIVSQNRKLAQLAGADSYPIYADDEVYGRDYSQEDVERFYVYVEEYMMPLCDVLSQKISSSNVLTLQAEISRLLEYDCSFSLMNERLEPYTAVLGSDFENAFSSFKEHVYTAESTTSSRVAFTAYLETQSTPICYFGPDYQSISTYVHELGHFNAYYFSKQSISSIDLCETQSQSNEWLYLAYIEDQYKASTYDALTSYYLLNQLITLSLATCCDYFERQVYATPSCGAEDYDELFIECTKELGAYDFLYEYLGNDLKGYWHYAVVANSMYYLSYAVSLIPAMELYLIAREQSFTEATARYLSLCTVEESASFKETVQHAQLTPPFSKEVFEKICQHFSK